MPFSRHPVRWLACGLWLVAACATVSRPPVAAPLDGFTAEARITAFQGGRRIRGTAVVAVRRPASLRVDVQGPQGVLSALATDGNSLTAIDFAAGTCETGPPDAEHFDRLLAWAPLHRDGAGWVELLLGETQGRPDDVLHLGNATATVRGRDPHGLPVAVHVEAPDTDVEVRLRDVDATPPAPAAFVLRLPAACRP